MTDRLAHRGPDSEGLVRRGAAALGHRRLAIIDLSKAGNQPMADSTGKYWIVFNGEIYNYRPLRAELEGHGICFNSNSDTEVILESYKKWGPDCFARFNGMFALALWDEPQQRLVMARDRLGKKPLYYHIDETGRVVLASELKALLEHPDVPRRINPTALGHYLALNYTLTDACILEGVHKLPPASYVVVDRDGLRGLSLYWDLANSFLAKKPWRSEKEAVETLAELIDDAVTLRLISDVPLGAFLSGGLDSSAIVASMCAQRPADENRTFTMGFDEKAFSEVPDAKQVAALLGVEHNVRVVDARMVDDLAAIMCAADEPFADSSIIPIYYLAGFAREHVTVCLSGDGGDEAFGGYETYVADKLCHSTRWLPQWVVGCASAGVRRWMPVRHGKVSFDYKLRHFLDGHGRDIRRAHYSWRLIFDDAERQALLRPDFRGALALGDPYDTFTRHYSAVDGCDYLDQAMYVDIKTWLVDDILTKVDRATMAHSLEARVPFLDYRIIEASASMPSNWRLKGLRKKHMLKETQRRRLPAEVIGRKKSGFGAPVSHWLRGGARELAYDTTTSAALCSWLDRKVIERLWNDHGLGRADNGLKLLGLTSLGMWLSRL